RRGTVSSAVRLVQDVGDTVVRGEHQVGCQQGTGALLYASARRLPNDADHVRVAWIGRAAHDGAAEPAEWLAICPDRGGAAGERGEGGEPIEPKPNRMVRHRAHSMRRAGTCNQRWSARTTRIGARAHGAL